jgi:hypothetical protein
MLNPPLQQHGMLLIEMAGRNFNLATIVVVFTSESCDWI